MPLQIEVGKKYRTRSGDVVEITSADDWGTFPFYGKLIKNDIPLSFTPIGVWGTEPGSLFDLIEEIIDHVAPAH